MFEQTAPDGEHGSEEKSYVLLTSEQITDMRIAAEAGDPNKWDEATRTAATINKQNPTLKIGRGEGGWLPGIGTDMSRLDDPQVGARYETISREQASITFDAQGSLHIADLGSKNGTNLYVSPNLVTPDVSAQSQQLVGVR